MSTFSPFQPLVTKATAGYGQQLGITTTSQLINIAASIGALTNSLMIEAFNPNPTSATAGTGTVALYAYVRIILEASGSTTATNADFCMIVPPQQTAVRLFATPQGNYNVAVVCTVSPSLAGATMTFYPGIGGTV